MSILSILPSFSASLISAIPRNHPLPLHPVPIPDQSIPLFILIHLIQLPVSGHRKVRFLIIVGNEGWGSGWTGSKGEVGVWVGEGGLYSELRGGLGRREISSISREQYRR